MPINKTPIQKYQDPSDQESIISALNKINFNPSSPTASHLQLHLYPNITTTSTSGLTSLNSPEASMIHITFSNTSSIMPSKSNLQDTQPIPVHNGSSIPHPPTESTYNTSIVPPTHSTRRSTESSNGLQLLMNANSLPNGMPLNVVPIELLTRAGAIDRMKLQSSIDFKKKRMSRFDQMYNSEDNVFHERTDFSEFFLNCVHCFGFFDSCKVCRCNSGPSTNSKPGGIGSMLKSLLCFDVLCGWCCVADQDAVQ